MGLFDNCPKKIRMMTLNQNLWFQFDEKLQEQPHWDVVYKKYFQIPGASKEKYPHKEQLTKVAPATLQ